MRTALFASLICAFAAAARAEEKPANPDDYAAVLATLKPGDTMRLAAGTYSRGLNLRNLNGRDDAWITVAGPVFAPGPGPGQDPPAVFVPDPCCNTIEIVNSSYIAVENVTVDGRHTMGSFGVSAKDGARNLVHHVRIEGCTFRDHDGSQQVVAISTKTPTWGWIIRGNRVLSAGTGFYLGNSNGADPFVGGIIEGNLFKDTIGYNGQIKFQTAWPNVPGLPPGPNTTTIRHNVFIKNDRPSPDGDRPNLLVDRGPDTGPGAMDRFEIYGNLFLHNPRESLIQVSGRVSIHDNVFADVKGAAIRAQDHAPATLVSASIYNNTIHSAGTGISFGASARVGDSVIGNLIFAGTPLSGPIQNGRDNLSDAAGNAGRYVLRPSITPGAMDFYPLPGQCRGAALDLSPFRGDNDWNVDFNGAPKGDFAYRGAYAGSGKNPGWPLDADLKRMVTPMPVVDGGAADLGGGTAMSGCDVGRGARSGGGAGAWIGLGMFVWAVRRWRIS